MLINSKLKFLSSLLLLVIFLIYSNWLILKEQNIPEPLELGNNAISTYGETIENLREKLPKDGVRIGYIADYPILLDRTFIAVLKKGDPGSPERKFYEKMQEVRKNYVISQYHLTPLLIHPNSYEPFVILNIKGSKADYTEYIPEKYKLVQDFGGGVMLFKDESR